MALAELRHWYARARQVIDGRDLLLLSPLGALATLAQLAWQRRQGVTAGPPWDDLEAYDPALLDVVGELVQTVGRHYFRLQTIGSENIPLHGPALFVGNHNGAVLPIDSLFTIFAVRQRTAAAGTPRVLHSLAHDIVFAHPTLGSYARRLGVVRARPRVAERALAEGRFMLVYPGSDWDACRPFAERHRVVLQNRLGFLRIALRTGAPIVPVVSVGTHEQLIILSRGDKAAKLLHLHRLLRVDALPLVLSLPWGLSCGYFPYLPLPAQTSLAFGPPLRFPDVTPAQAEDPAVLRRCYQAVEQQMQAMLDELSADRTPFLGQRRRAPSPPAAG